VDDRDSPSVEEIVAAALLRDAEAHEAGRFEEIGECWDEEYVAGQLRRVVDGQMLPEREDPSPTLDLAFEFWNCWEDDRNHDWLVYSDSIALQDWPQMAREIAAALRSDVAVTNPVLVRLCAPRPPRRTLRQRLGDLVRRSPTQP
jgi:hypothetical protein